MEDSRGDATSVRPIPIPIIVPGSTNSNGNEESSGQSVENVVGKVKKLIRQIAGARGSPDPRLLHKLAFIIEREEGRYQLKAGNSSTNQRSSYTIGRLVNLITDNEEFYELISSKLLLESGHSIAQRAAAARLFLSCVSCWMYPAAFEDAVLAKIKEWVVEDEPDNVATTSSRSKEKMRSVPSEGQSRDTEVLRTFATGLLAVALGGDEVVDDIVRTGIVGTLMRFLRARVLGDSDGGRAQQKALAIEEKTPAASAVGSTSRGRGQIESHRWVEGSHSEEVRAARGRQPREVLPPPPLEDATPSSDRGAADRGLASSIDRRGKTVERLDGSLEAKAGEEEGLVSLARELVWRQEDEEKRPREGEKVDGGAFVKRPRKDGQVDVAGSLAQPADRGRTKKGGRLASANAVQEGQQSGEEVEGRHENTLEEEEVEGSFEGERVVVGDVDVTFELHKAVRAAETEARAAGAHAEAMKAAGEAAAETVKQAASEAVAAGKTVEEVKDAARAAAMSIHDASIVAKLAVTAQSAAAEKEATPSGVEEEEEEGEAMKWQLSSDALGYLRERFCVLCMAAMGEYLEVLGPVLHERGVDICTAMLRRPWSTWLARAQQAMLGEEAAAGGVIALSEDGRLEEDGAAVALADVLKMVCTLSAHRKFASMFVDRGGVQLLLSVPRFPQTYLGLSLCLFAFASIQGVMERVCLLPPPVLSDMVGLALQLLTCHIDMARKNAALYFGSAFVFPTIVDIFDTQDGLRHILNLLRAAAVLRSGGGVSPPPPPAVPDGQTEANPQDHPTGVRGEVLEGFPFAPRADRAPEVLTSAGKQIAYHACVALRQYMRTNLILLVETLKPSSKTHKGGGSRSTGGGGRLAYKPVDVSNEAVEGVIMQLQRDRKLGQAFMKVKWPALEKLTDYGGVEVMLELTQALGPGEKYFNEIAQYALGVLQVATLSPLSHRKVLGTVLSNERPGMAVVLDAVSGTTFGDAEVIQAALLVLINLVCPPPSLCSRLPPGPGPAGQNAPPLNSAPAPPANHGSSAQPAPPSSAIQGSERGADRAWFGGTERREEGTRGSERERMERNLVERAGPSGVVAGVVGDRRITLGVGGGGCGIAAFMEQMYRQAREAVRQHNGIKILLHLLHPRTTLLHATPDCTRALACRALLGLARDCNIAHILTKLQVGKLLSELLRDSGSQATRTSATPEEGRWKAEFHRVALELITITMNTGRASTAAASEAAAPTLRRIERAAIAAATPITYSPRELLQLVHQHLYSLNLHQTAASLLREANLTPLLSAGPAPAPAPVLPATPTQFTTPSADSALFASLRTPTTMAPPPASIPFLSPIQPALPTFVTPSPQQTPVRAKPAVPNPFLAELPAGRVANGFLTEAAKPSAPPPPPPIRATEARKRAGLLHTPRLTIVQSTRATPTPPATNVSTPVGDSASYDSARAVGGGAPSICRPRIPSIKRKFEEMDDPASPFSPPLSAAARPGHPFIDEPLSSPPAAAMRSSTFPSTAATGAHLTTHDGLPPKTPVAATPAATPSLPVESQQSRLATMNHHHLYGGGTSSSGGLMMTMPGGLGSSVHAGNYNLQGGGGSGGSGEHATLDSIVIQYLKHQHRQCPAPITTLPPVSLLHPHVCPEPRRTLEAPLNAAARLVGARPRGPPYGGAHGKRYDRQFVYSRFRAWRSCRDESAIFTSVSFLGSASRVAVGSQEGEIRFFDSWSGDVVESYSCHNAPIYLLQSAPRGPSLGMEPSPPSTGALPEAQLLLSSTRYDVRLWDTEAMASPLASFDSVRAGRFNHSATKIVALSGDSIRREVLLYDVGTAQLAQTLHVSPSFASSGNPRGGSQQGPRFNPSDTLVLWNGILWDPRISNPLHKFDQFTNYGGGGFNPNGNDVVINSEVWDLRTYKLLRSVPSLDQTAITFNATGDVIYAILRRNTDELHKMLEDDGKARHSLFSSFRTIDATDYGDIATTLVDSQQPRWVMDLAVEPTESYIAVAAIDGKMDCFARLFEVGRRRPADDDSDYDNADESEEEDSEADDDIDDDDEDGQGEEEDAEVDLNEDGSDDGHGGNEAGPLEDDSEDDEDGRFPSDDEDDELGDDILGLLNEDDEDDHMHDSDSEYSDEGSSDSDYPPAANFDDLLQRMF